MQSRRNRSYILVIMVFVLIAVGYECSILPTPIGPVIIQPPVQPTEISELNKLYLINDRQEIYHQMWGIESIAHVTAAKMYGLWPPSQEAAIVRYKAHHLPILARQYHLTVRQLYIIWNEGYNKHWPSLS